MKEVFINKDNLLESDIDEVVVRTKVEGTGIER